jgi:hypothetical protein
MTNLYTPSETASLNFSILLQIVYNELFIFWDLARRYLELLGGNKSYSHASMSDKTGNSNFEVST